MVEPVDDAQTAALFAAMAFQALCEVLVEKGAMSRADVSAVLEKVRTRAEAEDDQPHRKVVLMAHALGVVARTKAN